jgi:hypothetical protein
MTLPTLLPLSRHAPDPAAAESADSLSVAARSCVDALTDLLNTQAFVSMISTVLRRDDASLRRQALVWPSTNLLLTLHGQLVQ